MTPAFRLTRGPCCVMHFVVQAATEQTSPFVTNQTEPKQRPVSEDTVRLRAYHLYLQRGAAPGNELDDWLQAERELRQAN